MNRRTLLIAALAGAALFFALGWLASRATGPAQTSGDAKTPRNEPRDAGPPEPILLIDAASIELLPGKELRLDPPAPPAVEPSNTR